MVAAILQLSRATTILTPKVVVVALATHPTNPNTAPNPPPTILTPSHHSSNTSKAVIHHNSNLALHLNTREGMKTADRADIPSISRVVTHSMDMISTDKLRASKEDSMALRARRRILVEDSLERRDWALR